MNEIKARQALLLQQQAARLLEEALSESGGIIEPPKPPPVEKPVVYGRNSYTDSHDPRDSSANHHGNNNGRITAVHTQVHVLPKKLFRCTGVRVIGEGTEAAGQHIAKVYQSGSELVGLFVNYGGEVDGLQLVQAHDAGREIIISSKFNPPNLGGLAIAIVDSFGIASDVVASLGLPYGHHVSYEISFERR